MFRDLVLARIIEPTSKLDSLRVLDEVGVDAAVLSPRSSAGCRSIAKPRVAASTGGGVRRPCRARAGVAWCSTT